MLLHVELALTTKQLAATADQNTTYVILLCSYCCFDHITSPEACVFEGVFFIQSISVVAQVYTFRPTVLVHFYVPVLL